MSLRPRNSMAASRGRLSTDEQRYEAEAPERRRGLALAPMDDDPEETASPEALRMADALLAIALRLDNSLQVLVHSMTDSQTFDVSSDKSIGHDPSNHLFLRLRLAKVAEDGGSIVIRQFTDRKEMAIAPNGREMLMPWKNVYGAFIQGAQMSPEGIPAIYTFSRAALLDSYSTDAATGADIEPEPLLNFCDFADIVTDADRQAIRVEAMPDDESAQRD